jgi:hypothetical protein
MSLPYPDTGSLYNAENIIEIMFISSPFVRSREVWAWDFGLG